MDIRSFLHRLSLKQLKALQLLAKTKAGVAGSSVLGKKLKITGKALGGLFSSISRQQIDGERLILAWGKTEPGCGLRWRLNQKLISQKELLKITGEILKYD